jgi:hypothetical protein
LETVVKDAYISRLIERIGDHYSSNISNRFIRPALLHLSIEKQTWDLIDALTEKNQQYQYQGYPLDDLYRQVVAAARFVSTTRRELVPSLRSRLSMGGSSGTDKVLRDLAINNFSSNIQLFADLVNEMYAKLVEFDKANAKNKTPVYFSIPGVQDIESMLA